MSARNESLKPSHAFSELTQSFGHLYSLHMDVAFYILRNKSEFFKDLMDISFCSFFLLNLLVKSVVCSNFYLPPEGSHKIKQSLVIVFDKCPGERAFHTGWVLQVLFCEPPHRSNNAHSLQMILCRICSHPLLLLMVSRMLVFTAKARC